MKRRKEWNLANETPNDREIRRQHVSTTLALLQRYCVEVPDLSATFRPTRATPIVAGIEDTSRKGIYQVSITCDVGVAQVELHISCPLHAAAPPLIQE